MMTPKNCQGRYVPWICGFCEMLGRCPFMGKPGRGKR